MNTTRTVSLDDHLLLPRPNRPNPNLTQPTPQQILFLKQSKLRKENVRLPLPNDINQINITPAVVAPSLPSKQNLDQGSESDSFPSSTSSLSSDPKLKLLAAPSYDLQTIEGVNHNHDSPRHVSAT